MVVFTIPPQLPALKLPFAIPANGRARHDQPASTVRDDPGALGVPFAIRLAAWFSAAVCGSACTSVAHLRQGNPVIGGHREVGRSCKRRQAEDHRGNLNMEANARARC